MTLVRMEQKLVTFKGTDKDATHEKPLLLICDRKSFFLHVPDIRSV